MGFLFFGGVFIVWHCGRGLGILCRALVGRYLGKLLHTFHRHTLAVGIQFIIALQQFDTILPKAVLNISQNKCKKLFLLLFSHFYLMLFTKCLCNLLLVNLLLPVKIFFYLFQFIL